ncbi:sigma factor, partial [Streptomyces albidoflavus]
MAPPDFETFAAARWPRLLRTAYLLTGDHHEAEDLVQVTLAKLFPAWPRVRGLDEPDAYVRRALVNNNLSRFRKRRVVQLLTPRLPERALIAFLAATAVTRFKFRFRTTLLIMFLVAQM